MRCILSKASLCDDDIDYSALSYVWGDPNDTQVIQVNGAPFHATKNLVGLYFSHPFSLTRFSWKGAGPVMEPTLADICFVNHPLPKL